MTYILALDSSTDACSVALISEGEVTSLFEMAAKSHTQRLLPMVDELLHQTGCKPGDVDAIAFGRGPGSFTGLRICLGAVQGLAFGLQVPVIPVSTLMAMAAGYYYASVLAEKKVTRPVLVALDARMNEVYWGLFKSDADSVIPDALTPEFVMLPAVVANEIVQQNIGEVVGVGSGWGYSDLQTLPCVNVEREFYPHAGHIARIAAELYARGEVLPVKDAQPIYLRDQVSWKKRQRIRTDELL